MNILEQLKQMLTMLSSLSVDKRIMLLSTGQKNIGQKLCPIAGNEFGCMESFDRIFLKTFGTYINGNKITPELSTTKGYFTLSNSKLFIKVNKPRPGTVIISPTVGKNIGHIGLFSTDGTIMSNSSINGRWDIKFNLTSWTEYYKNKKGLDIHYFDVV